MMKLLVQLPADRRRSGEISAVSAEGKHLRGPWRVLGMGDDRKTAPMKDRRDTPAGVYKIIRRELRSDEEKFGYKPIFILQPEAGGKELFLCGGRVGQAGGLRPASGNLRVDDDTMVIFHAMENSRGMKFAYLEVVALEKAPMPSRKRL
jgi:hypothetical protein